jgi:murein DD-endopeptidase MepM/ murein hydrolase activator NlpD
MYISRTIYIAFLVIAINCLPSFSAAEDKGFAWPATCVPGLDCVGQHFRIGYPDVAATGLSFACSKPGYTGHQGTDIVVSSVEQGVQALAAADGVVRWIKDGLYDLCPNEAELDCDEQQKSELLQSERKGATLGFNAGNFVMIEHKLNGSRYLTLYAHLRKGSLKVASGQKVSRGELLAEVGSSGNSQVPHLHFGVYKEEGAMYRPVDPWKGACNTSSEGLWASSPPYRSEGLQLAYPGSSTTINSEIYLQTIQRSRPKNKIY